MKSIIKKEINQLLNNPYGYIILILFAVFANFIFVKDLFVIGTVSMKQFFQMMPWILMIFMPALSMRLMSEEKRLNTIEVLRTLPLTESQIVVGKFVALIIATLIGLALTLGLPISLNSIASATGSLYLPEVFIGYIGVLFYAAMAGAISLFFSGMTSNQVVSFLLSAITMFLLNMIGGEFLGTVLPKAVQDVMLVLSPLNQLIAFTNGVLDIRSIFYFISVTSVFVFLSVVDLEKRS
ncbi:MAG: ABC transporter permease subunit [Patescibacteria group bacterium]